jgi:hypothetical protein
VRPCITMDSKVTRREGANWIHVTWDMGEWRAHVNTAKITARVTTTLRVVSSQQVFEQIDCAFCLMRATCANHLLFCDLIVSVFGDASHYAVCSFLHPSLPSS